MTTDAAPDQLPVWSPNGGLVAFTSNRKGMYDLYVKPSAGAGMEQLLLDSPYSKLVTDWSRDGRFLLYQYADPKTGWDLSALPMTGNDRKTDRGGEYGVRGAGGPIFPRFALGRVSVERDRTV